MTYRCILIVLFSALNLLPVYSNECSLCPSETELFSSVKSQYSFKFIGKGAGNLNKRFRGLKLLLFTDLDSKNGFKYDVVNRKGINYFGDGFGIIDHEVVYFNLPFNHPSGKLLNFNCISNIIPESSEFKGGLCITTFQLPGKQLSLFGQKFIATPLNKISIISGDEVKGCLSMSCPELKSSVQFLMSNYNFSANLVTGRTENYEISFSVVPTKDGDAPLLKYDVFDLDSNNLLFGGGTGFVAYRKIYFDLPVLVDGRNNYVDFGCVGTINPSDSSINGDCKTIQLNANGQLETVGGSFKAVVE